MPLLPFSPQKYIIAGLSTSRGEGMDRNHETITPAPLPSLLDAHELKDYGMQALSVTDDLAQQEQLQPRSRLRLFSVLTGLNVSSLWVHRYMRLYL